LISTKRITEKSKKRILFLQLIECVIFATPIYIYIYKESNPENDTKKKECHRVQRNSSKTPTTKEMFHFDDDLVFLRPLPLLNEFSDASKELNVKLGFDP
jgi:hypothetical protein